MTAPRCPRSAPHDGVLGAGVAAVAASLAIWCFFIALSAWLYPEVWNGGATAAWQAVLQ